MEDTIDKVHDLAQTSLEGSCDMFVHEDFSNVDYDSVRSNPLDHSHASPLCSLSSPSAKYYIYVPINNPIICDANVFDVLGRNVGDYLSLGCFRGYNSLD